MMVDKVEAPDPKTVVFRLKFATTAFLPALADPRTPSSTRRTPSRRTRTGTRRTSSGRAPSNSPPTRPASRSTGCATRITTTRACPISTGSTASIAQKQATRIDAMRSDRAAIEFRGLPPAARDELKAALGDKIAVQESDWNCGSLVDGKPRQEAVRRRAGAARADPGDRPLARRPGAVEDRRRAHRRRHRLPGHAAGRRPRSELQQIAGFWPDIEKSRAEAQRLLKEAGAEGLSFELLNRNVDQPYKYVGTWLVDEWSKIGVKVTQRMVPTGPWLDAMRRGDFEVVLQANCHSVPTRCSTCSPTCRARSSTAITAITKIQTRWRSTTRCCTRPTRPGSAADARIREACHRYRGARDVDRLVVSRPCRTGLTSRAGRSARAISSTRTSRQSGSTSRLASGSRRPL